MKILEHIESLRDLTRPVCIAIGYFDGVHLGHQAVIHDAVVRARANGGVSVALTFNPHPARILRPQESPLMLTSLEHKIGLIKELDADFLLMQPFTLEFARTEPESFIRRLHAVCSPLTSISVGHQWAFGHARKGNVALIRTLGGELGFDVGEVPPVEVNGETVSSTLIRKFLREGDLFTVSRFLGRPYSILGEVVHGDQRGRKIGFPTANLHVGAESLPPEGVYVCRARVDGRTYPAVANVGGRPTVSDCSTPASSVEAHLLDFQGDLYGRRVEVFFKKFLRPEKKIRFHRGTGRANCAGRRAGPGFSRD
ncbi:bifunctional riboflavin kinase/FAD synthetase [Kamptonema cortianum]|nr:bifunctional riboflavin kinase/FAD synthetase [Kamptonema cortianum]